MSCIAGLCCDALEAVKSQSCCHEPGERSPREKGVGACLSPSPKELQGRGVARLEVRVGMDRLFPLLNFSASRQPKMTFKTRTMLTPTDRHRESRLIPNTPDTWTSTVVEKHFCPHPSGPLGRCGSRSSVLQDRKGWQGRSSPGCKSALSLPGRTMPAQFTPAEDLIGVWLWLQN